MKIEEFLAMKKSCKQLSNVTSDKSTRTCIVNPERTRYKLGEHTEIKIYSQTVSVFLYVIVTFKEPVKSLTVFEADLLYNMVGHGKVPHDYAEYHKCPAGKKFIENIVKVEKQVKVENEDN